MNHWITGLLFAALAAAADPPNPPDVAAPSAPAAPIDPMFDCYSANSAWGLAYSGKVIDRSGRIWSYEARGKALPDAVKDKGVGYYAATALVAKFAGSTAGALVDATTLAEKNSLIEKAAAGKITQTDTGVRDAGSSTCHAYVFDAASKRYRDVELGSDGGVGDRHVGNDAAEAQMLLQWLREAGVAN
jgi:hypothetical protein